jgi:ubiquitin-like 1-activating enzyme E1 A
MMDAAAAPAHSTPAPVAITEDEAALYDRQIRLWGVDAQQRMRNASILVLGLRGIATETIKNIVLAGVGKITLIDGELVSEEDLGCGFFFTANDVGKPRVDAAEERIQDLNPRVTIETVKDESVLDNDLDDLIRAAHLVCATDKSKQMLLRVDEACRRLGKMFYAGGTYGMIGYVFADLGTHEYIATTKSSSNPQDSSTKPRNVKFTTTYPSLAEALDHSWKGVTRSQTRELNPIVLFTVLALWEYQSLHGKLPNDVSAADELESIANRLLTAAAVNKQAASSVPRDLVEPLSITSYAEFSPICAVVGGVLAQDLLKALAGKEPPLMNFFTFDGNVGTGNVARLSMK